MRPYDDKNRDDLDGKPRQTGKAESNSLGPRGHLGQSNFPNLVAQIAAGLIAGFFAFLIIEYFQQEPVNLITSLNLPTQPVLLASPGKIALCPSINDEYSIELSDESRLLINAPKMRHPQSTFSECNFYYKQATTIADIDLPNRVRLIQTVLTHRGIYSGPIDGKNTSSTKEAVSRYKLIKSTLSEEILETDRLLGILLQQEIPEDPARITQPQVPSQGRGKSEGLPCSAYRAGAPDSVACNDNTEPGYYWRIVRKEAHYSVGGTSPQGPQPRCDEKNLNDAKPAYTSRFPPTQPLFQPVHEKWVNNASEDTAPGCNYMGEGILVGEPRPEVCGIFTVVCSKQP